MIGRCRRAVATGLAYAAGAVVLVVLMAFCLLGAALANWRAVGVAIAGSVLAVAAFTLQPFVLLGGSLLFLLFGFIAARNGVPLGIGDGDDDHYD